MLLNVKMLSTASCYIIFKSYYMLLKQVYGNKFYDFVKKYLLHSVKSINTNTEINFCWAEIGKIKTVKYCYAKLGYFNWIKMKK